MKFTAWLALGVSMVLAQALPASAAPGSLRISTLSLKAGLLELRVGVQGPADGAPVGDILYLHGFADRLDNHDPLFRAWNDAGFRVISFDLPSHGGTRGLLSNLDFFGFEELGRLAAKVERATRQDDDRPLILAGWSTGGLLATRIAQNGWLPMYGARQPKGLILFAPGVAVHPWVGEKGIVTERTLTNNPAPPHRGPISPLSPLLKPKFAATLLWNASEAASMLLPGELPVLTILGGDVEDVYVNTPKVRDWTLWQRLHSPAPILGMQCPRAKHELDNEPLAVGPSVREAAAAFAKALAQDSMATFNVPAGVCHAF